MAQNTVGQLPRWKIWCLKQKQLHITGLDQVVEGSVLQESRLEPKAVWRGGADSQGRILNEGLT